MINATETYVTHTNPTVEDWLMFNQDFFDCLRGLSVARMPQYAPLTDVDLHAAAAGQTPDQLYETLKEKVGNLGEMVLDLVRTDHDGGWHIIVTDVIETEDF